MHTSRPQQHLLNTGRSVLGLIALFGLVSTAASQADTRSKTSACAPSQPTTNIHEGNFYAGETHLQVTALQKVCAGGQLPPSILIRSVATGAPFVSMDPSAAGRLHTRLFLHKDPDSPEAAQALAEQVRTSFGKGLTAKLTELHIASGIANTASDHGDVLIVEIHLQQIEAGNKGKRVMIGLGRGASTVTASATLIARRGGEEFPLETIQLDSESGKKLGVMTSPFGGLSAVNIAEGNFGDRKSTPQADANRMGKGLAVYLGKLTGIPEAPISSPANL